MIIDQSYFVREINIPQLSQPHVWETVELFGTKYQKRFLRDVFGLELAKLIEQYLEEEDNEVATLDERIGLILDGAEFTYNGQEKEWGGLRNTDKVSPLANFIFYQFTNDGITQQTQVGEAFGTAENSQKASPDGRLVFAWIEMVEMLESLRQLMESGDFPEYRPELVYEIQNRFNL